MIKYIFKKHWFLMPLGILMVIHNIIRIVYTICNYNEMEYPLTNIGYGVFLICIFCIMFIYFVGEYYDNNGLLKDYGDIES